MIQIVLLPLNLWAFACCKNMRCSAILVDREATYLRMFCLLVMNKAVFAYSVFEIRNDIFHRYLEEVSRRNFAA